jgi:hypothetical protein
MIVSERPRTSRTSRTRTVAWVLLLLCAAGNMAVSVRGGALVVHLVLGVATLLCIATLVAPYLRGTR